MKSIIFCWLNEVTLSLHPPNQPHVTNADKNLATWGRIQGDTKDDDDLLQMKSIIFCWLNEVTLSLHPQINPTSRMQTKTYSHLRSHSRRHKRWWWSTSNEEYHLLLTQWNHSIPSSLKWTPCHQCGQKPSHLRSHSKRRKMMMIYFKWRVSSFADSLKSLYPFIPQINPKPLMRTKT